MLLRRRGACGRRWARLPAMAKLLYCMDCGHLESFDPAGGVTRCKCAVGPVVGWWVDPDIALCQMAVLPPGDVSKARVVSIVSGFLTADEDILPPGYRGPAGETIPFQQVQVDQMWRDLATESTVMPPRPESTTIFDRSRRNSVIVVQKPGTTPDTHWATEPELARRKLLEPAAAR